MKTSAQIALAASLILNIFLLGFQRGYYLKKIKRSLEYKIKVMGNTEQDCPQNSLNIAFFGQSNSANHVPKTVGINQKKYMYDYISKKCFKYKEPVLGASGSEGNVISDLVVKLENKLNKPILIIALGESGSSVLDWQYGKYSDKLYQLLSAKVHLKS